MPRDLAGELRGVAEHLRRDLIDSRADATREFWKLARELRAALPPLLLPHRSESGTGSGRPRIGYLAADSQRLAANLESLSHVHGAGDEDVLLYLPRAAEIPLPLAWASTVDLGALSELQAARAIARADLDALIDLDGATLMTMPLLIALHPARAIIEPLFEPVQTGVAGSPQGASGTSAKGAEQLAQLGRKVAEVASAATVQLPLTTAELNGWLERAIRLHQAGDLRAARAAYEEALARYPEHPIAAYMLGQLLYQQGHGSEAIPWLYRAAQAVPEFRDAHYTLGQRLADAGRWDEAAAAYRSALDLTPDFAAGWSGLGLTAQHDRNIAGSEANGYLERAIALEPGVDQWRFNLGAARQRRGDLAAARRVYEELLAHRPEHFEALFNLATVAQEQADYARAIAAYRVVLQRQPDLVAAYPQLGVCLQFTGQIEAWLENFRHYRAACPESLAMAVYGLEASMAAGDPAAHQDWRDRILAGGFATDDDEEFTRNWEQLLFFLLHSDLDREVLHQWYQRYDTVASACYGRPGSMPGRRRAGRIRIGYLSGDLREHVMGRMIYELISRHDRERYEVRLYSLSPTKDALTARFVALGIPLVDLWSLPHDVAAARIRDDDIDLLIDCCGHTRGAQPGILAHKPARVMATHIATPGPVGLRAIDYKLTDTFAESGDAQQFVLERLLAVPGGVFPWHRYPVPGRLQRSILGIAPDALVCGTFVSLMKLSPRCLDLWRRILERLPRAVLAFSPAQPSWHPAYLRWLHAHGIGRERVVFVPRPPDEAGQLARYHLLDVALDPLPCGNVNGTMEALAMGVPVVTLVGLRHGERLGHTLLSRFGETATIARDDDEYIGIVERLGHDRQWAAQVRARVAQGLIDSPVWDSALHVRGLEAAYEQILAEHNSASGGQ